MVDVNYAVKIKDSIKSKRKYLNNFYINVLKL